MPARQEPRVDRSEPIEFHSLHESPLVAVREYQCRACRGGPAREEQSCANQIVLMRQGAFSKHFGRTSVTADVNQAVFFSKASTYRVSHPADCGDRGTIISPSPRVLLEIVREIDPAVDDRPERPFPFVTGPTDSRSYWRHREIVTRLHAAERGAAVAPDPLWVDEQSLQLAADVTEAAFLRHGRPRPSRREGTDEDHREIVEATRIHLASRLSERVTLESIALALHWSPFHLARVFQRQTGVPIHRYFTRLRLRTALERLPDASDLTTLALELGFASHSHFADSFRAEFGRSPSAARRDGLRARRQMRKNPEVRPYGSI